MSFLSNLLGDSLKDPLGLYKDDVAGIGQDVGREPPKIDAAGEKPAERPMLDDPDLPAGMRNNNPGNIKYREDVPWNGLTGPSVNTDQGDPQAVFQSPELGMRAAAKLARNKYNKGLKTPLDIITGDGGWTPGNAQAAENIAKTMGIGVNDDLRLDDPEQNAAFLRALITQEHGPASKRYDEKTIKDAVVASYDENAGKPAGVKAIDDNFGEAAGLGGEQDPAIDAPRGGGGDPEAKGLARLAPKEPTLAASDFLKTRLVGHTADHIDGMQTDMQDRVAAMFAAAPPEIADKLGIFSGARSVKRQKDLWKAALKKYGSAKAARKWVAPPGRSMHNKGVAADLSYNGVSLAKAPKEVVAWVHENAGAYGLTFPLSNENWHVETIEARGGKLPDGFALPKGMARPASTDAERIVVGADFKSTDPFGIYRDRENPFAVKPVETVAAPAAEVQPAAATLAAPAGENVQNVQPPADGGRYQEMDEGQFEAWKADWEKTNRSSGIGGDIWRILKSGTASTITAAHEVAQRLPAVGEFSKLANKGVEALTGINVDQEISTRLNEWAEKANASVTPAQREADQKKFFEEVQNPDGSVRIKMGAAWSDPRTYMRLGVESIPGSVVTMGPAGMMAKGAYATTFAKEIAGGATKEVAERTAAAAAARTATIAGSVSEGALGGGQSAVSVRQKIETLPRQVVEQSEAYQALIKQGVSPDEAFKSIREDAATQAFVMAGVTTGMFGGLGDRALAKIIGEGIGGNIVKRTVAGGARGAVGEGVFEELPQGVAQQATENLAVSNANNDQRIMEGVPEAAARGVAGGAAVGGGIGAVAGAASPAAAESGSVPSAETPVAPGTPPARPGGIADAVEQGQRAAPQQAGPAAVSRGAAPVDPADRAKRAAANPNTPGVGSTVRVDEPDIPSFMARVESIEGDEAVVFDGSTGEVYQVPLSSLSKLADEGGTIAKPNREIHLDPVAEPETTKAAPAAESKPTGKTRTVNGRSTDFPDEQHASLYDLGEKLRISRGGNQSTSRRDHVLADERQEVADSLGVPVERVNEIADDYRYRVERQSRSGEGTFTANPVKPDKLAEWQRQRARTAGQSDTPADAAAAAGAPASPESDGFEFDPSLDSANLEKERSERIVAEENADEGFAKPPLLLSGAKSASVNSIPEKPVSGQPGSQKEPGAPSFVRNMTPEGKAAFQKTRPADRDIAILLGRKIDEITAAGGTERAAKLQAKLDGILQAIMPTTASDGTTTRPAAGKAAGGLDAKTVRAAIKILDEGFEWDAAVAEAKHRAAGGKPNKAPDPEAGLPDGWTIQRAKGKAQLRDPAGETVAEADDTRSNAEWLTERAKHHAGARAKEAKVRAGEAAAAAKAKQDEIDAAAHEAAPSPQNDRPEPTQAQKEAGNYAKGHIRLGGLDISIENPEGSERKGTSGSGKAWSVTMKSHYGYIRGTVGKDKDHIDVFIKPGTTALDDDSPIFVVDQVTAGGSYPFDEHKVMIGFATRDEARAAYLENYAKGWKGARNITATTLDQFHEWLETGDTTKEFASWDGRPGEAGPDDAEAAKFAAIDEGFAKNRAVLGNFKKGDKVEFTQSGTFRNPDGTAREGRLVTGTVRNIASKEQGTLIVDEDGGGDWNVSARSLRKATGPAKAAEPAAKPANPIKEKALAAAAKRKADEEAARKAAPAPKPKGEQIGVNRDGHPVYEDEKGVRSFVANGVRITEPVGFIPGGGISINTADRNANFLPVEETAPSAKPAGSGNTIFTDDAAEKARAILKAKLSGAQLTTGIDPEILQAGLTLAGWHIEKGARSFGQFAQAMLTDLGEVARPYLKSWYMGVKYDPKASNLEGMSPAGEVDAADVAAYTVAATKDASDEPSKLDQPSPGTLEGIPAEQVQKPVRSRGARPSTAGSGEPDLFGGQPAGGRGDATGRGVGDREPALSDAAAGRQPGDGTDGDGDVPRGDAERPADEPGPRVDASQSAATPAADRPVDYTITDDDELGKGGAKTKYRQNVAAIRILQQLEAERRPATREEQTALAKWVGWGGLKQAFGRDDGTTQKGWEREVADLKEILTGEEYRAAEQSTRNAHYTSPEIVRAMWKMAEQLGFTGGQVLEPSIGSGNFIGLMPARFRTPSHVTGVELDRITGSIAKNLFPKANIQAPLGFQDLTVPDDYFDLAIGNPPFGGERLYDAERRHLNKFSIHNFFFAKAVDALRPGGVLAMVVTNYFMDSTDSSARDYIAKKALLLGAIRLPNDAFLSNAGTEVTTDIILLQKLEDGVAEVGLPAEWRRPWSRVVEHTDKEGRKVNLNEYFVGKPENMLGEFGAYGTMYGPDQPALVSRPGDKLPELLDDAIERLPYDIMPAPGAMVTETVTVPENAGSAIVNSAFLSPEGDVWVRDPDSLGRPQATMRDFGNDTAKQRVAGMIRVRDAFARIRKAQLDPAVGDERLDRLRVKLNERYDSFVRRFGPIHVPVNRQLFRDDPTWPQVSALENNFDKGISAAVAKSTGENARAPSAEKAAIFTKRTQHPYKAPTSASSAKDALSSTLNQLGRVDLPYMANLYGKSEDEIIAELGSLLFRTPDGQYETAAAYLSGNVKAKLAQAEDRAKIDPELERNVLALRAVIPTDIAEVDIAVKAGAPWIPQNQMVDFLTHILETAGSKAVWSPLGGKWIIEQARASEASQLRWGTGDASAGEVARAALTGSRITIYEPRRADGTAPVDEKATEAANEKVERVKDEWRRWIWQDDDRREQLHRLYNDTFNTDVKRAYDGQHLTLPGKVGDDVVALRPHQKSFVWRGLQTATALADHTVGAGKTFALIALAMEKRRIGQAKKPMFVVPNHLVGQWAADFIKLYPGAKILAATKKDFEKDNRKRLFARVASGDYDAVIVAHSSFGKIGVDPKFEAAFIQQLIDDHMEAEKALRSETGKKDGRAVAQIAKARANLEAKLKKLLDAGGKDVGMTFEEMGLDALFVDEAHEFKNLSFATGMQRVAGLNNTGSQKASDLFIKIQSVLERTGGKNIVFATGTPISNTMGEMYTMQRYLDYQSLKDQGIAHFDAWAAVFGEVVNDWELSPTGKYKMKSRFSKFVNIPELMQRYTAFADVITNDDIKAQMRARGQVMPLPKVKGGKPANIVVPRSRAQAAFIGIPTVDANGVETYHAPSLIWRAENLRGKPEKGADNMLKIMSDARKAALDMRLVDSSQPDVPGSKVHIAADNIKRLYTRWNADRGTQLVFIDLSTPKKAVAKERAKLQDLIKLAETGDEDAQTKLDEMSPDEFDALMSDFSVYDDLRQKLIDRGIPAGEIAFIHDSNTEAQKEDLFGKVRAGRIRVLFGSTAKMGAGMNVQNRLVGIHHLDAPWRPSDLEQRDGRGIRQGNELYAADPEGFELEINRYATENTLDAVLWQAIERKARFIAQVRKGDSGEREAEDVAGEAASAAEMKAAASGNPLILEEMDLRRQVKKLRNASAEHDRVQHQVKRALANFRTDLAGIERNAPKVQADADAAKALLDSPIEATIGGAHVTRPGELGAAIINAAAQMLEHKARRQPLGKLGGRQLRMEASALSNSEVYVHIDGERHDYIAADINPKNADNTGVGMTVLNTFKRMIEAPALEAKRKVEIEGQIPKVEAQIAPWDGQAKLEEAEQKHRDIINILKPKPKEAAAAAAPWVIEPAGDRFVVQRAGGKAKEDVWGHYDTEAEAAKGLTKAVMSDVKVVPPGASPIMGWDTVEGGPQDSELTDADRAEIGDIVRQVAGLDDVSWTRRITIPANHPEWGNPDASTAGGFYDPIPDAITIATASGSGSGRARRIAYHEAFHRLQRLFLTARERAVLTEEVGRLRRMVGENIARAGQEGRMSQKELEAEAFAIYAAGAAKMLPHKSVRAVWDKLALIFRRIRNVLSGRGFQTAEDVFARAKAGDIAARGRADRGVTLDGYKGKPAPAVLVGGKYFVGDRHQSALEDAAAQFGLDSPEIAAFENDPKFGMLRPGRFSDGVSGDAGRGLLAWLKRARGRVLGEKQFSLTENRVVEEVRGKFVDWTPAMLATIPLNYFTELARPTMVAVGEYLRLKRTLDAYRGKKHAEADETAQAWLSYTRKGKAGAVALADLMHDATLAGVDPSKTTAEARGLPGYAQLHARWLALPVEARRLFSTVRDAYKTQSAELDAIILDNIRKAQLIAQKHAEEEYRQSIERIQASRVSPQAKKDAIADAAATYKVAAKRSELSMKARLTKMRQLFESSRVPEPYFPLARFGEYTVTVRDVDGTILSFSKREKAAERDRLAADMRAAYPGATVTVGVMSATNELRGSMDPRIVAEIEEIIARAGLDPKTMGSVLDGIWQRYLETMPDLSIRKRFIHRQGTQGFEKDAMRAFGSHMFHAAHQMARLKYGAELQELANDALDQARKSDDPTRGGRLANELAKRHDWVMNPTGSSVAQVMTSAAFVWFLGMTPAAAIVNTSQTPIIGIPVLGGRFGSIPRAAAAIAKAAVESVAGRGLVSKNPNLSADEKSALEAFYESGLIDRTQSHDIAGVGETGVEYNPMRSRVMKVISWMFHNAEVWNREVTALAAYRMARADGQNVSDAIDTAHDLTWKVHFDYSNSSRPRIMQNDVAKVALVFRAYNINMLYRVFRDAHQAFKGETPKARAEARRQLVGIMAMMSLMAGTTGVVGFNLAMAIAQSIFGDDDDPMDFATHYRKDVVDILGPQLGGVVLDGVPGHYLGIDLTTRMGMPDLWFRSPPRDLQGRDEFEYYIMNALGASVSMLGSLWQGGNQIVDGDVGKGIETVAPKWARDLMKAYRFSQEGVTNFYGDQIMPPDAMDSWDIIAQSLGFTPAKVAETYDRSAALKNAEGRILDKRRELLNAFAMAVQLQDPDGRSDALARIKAFNAVPINKPLAITGDTLKQSLKARARNAAKREDGVLIANPALSKKLRQALPERLY